MVQSSSSIALAPTYCLCPLAAEQWQRSSVCSELRLPPSLPSHSLTPSPTRSLVFSSPSATLRFLLPPFCYFSLLLLSFSSICSPNFFLFCVHFHFHTHFISFHVSALSHEDGCSHSSSSSSSSSTAPTGFPTCSVSESDWRPAGLHWSEELLQSWA